MDSDPNDLNSSDKIEELRKRFFVGETEYNQQLLEKHLEKILEYAVITSDGKVLLKNKDIIDKDKVGVIILARYIGNKLDDSVDEIVTINEISEYSKIDRQVVRARLSTLVEERIILRDDRGKYIMNPINIDKFLLKLEE